MSYQTNPILNRLKVIKGWKNPYLPTKTLNYSRDIALWFKVYLLLKLFLNLKKLQLLSCEIRFDQQNQKILYLVINKKKNKKNKKKNFKKKNVSLKWIRTPIKKIINRSSIFFLYRNISFLKQMSFFNQNVMHKKVLSKFWLTKPKTSTFLNTLEKITNIRELSKKNCKFLQKNKNFTPIQHTKLKFYTIKQKQLLAQKLRIKKTNSILYARIFELLQQKKSQNLHKFAENLKKKMDQNKIEIDKINKVYAFLSILSQNVSKKKKNQKDLTNLILHRFRRKKISILLKRLKNQFYLINRIKFLKKKLPSFCLKFNKKLFSQIPNPNNRFLKKNLLLKNILQLNFIISELHNKNFLIKNYSLFSTVNQKFLKNINKNSNVLENFQLQNILKAKFNKVTRKKWSQYWIYQIYIWFLLRLNKKKKRKKRNLKKINKIFKFRLKNSLLNKYLFSQKNKFLQQDHRNLSIIQKIQKINKYVKRNQIVRTYKYRLPYRKLYFSFLQFNTKLKLKYLIQDFVQKYFSLQVEAKTIHFLNTHKNQNYFRLVFPIWKKKKNQQIQKFRQKTWKQKQLFFTSQLQVVTTETKKNIQSAQTKFKRKNPAKSLKKKNVYSLAQKKIKNLRIQKSFKRIKGNKDFRHSFKYFITSLMYFSRTLDPQLLADLLAKVIYKAKKQTWMLSTVKDILKMIKLGKNVGYKIALAGRINSSDKSRLIYITRKNVPLQVFDQNMNFAYSQAKARIGVFGIKIWVYF